MRTVAAFVLSPLLVAFMAPMAIEGALATYPATLLVGTIPVTYLFTVAVALPLYLSLSSQQKERLILILAAAFIAGFVSLLVVSLATTGFYEEVDGSALVDNGWYTISGVLVLAKQCLLMGTAGSLAGLLFWWIARRRHRANPSFKRTPDSAA